MATLALVNLGLVAFDLSYIPWRDWYLFHLPKLTQWYGEQFKGIEPHRDTEAYLQTVDRLKRQVTQTGFNSPEAEALLADLRTQSIKMIDENPFALVDKSGTLERIKDRMRQHIGQESSKQAFTLFWSQEHLNQADWQPEVKFFDAKIRPLIETNYFRHISTTGGFVNQFWQIDIWFVGVFAAELLVRTVYLSRRYRGVSWLDVILWRWYDLLLLIPFWRWLRVIPVTTRLNQAKLVNLEPLRARINHVLVANFAVELTEIVVLRILDQTQNLIRTGNVSRWLLKPGSHRYIELSGVDEIDVITKRVLSIFVQQVLPQLQPELKVLIQHSLDRVLQQSPLYSSLEHLPGFETLHTQLTERLTVEIVGVAQQAIATSIHDDTGQQLVRQLIEKLVTSFRTEIQKERTLEELEALLTVLLEEIKINYVQQLGAEDIEKLREQTHQLYRMTQARTK
jgi:hypothetical protein